VADFDFWESGSRSSQDKEKGYKSFSHNTEKDQVLIRISSSITVCCLTRDFRRELSNGHFSDDNQKRLVGTNTPIPIYEAKMTRDSRLVVGVVLLLENFPPHPNIVSS
jgi:hypothetical protein